MKTKLFITLSIALGICANAFAQYAPDSTNVVAVRRAAPSQSLFVDATNVVVNLPIPDNNQSGVASTLEFSTPIKQIGDLNVNLKISGGFNGDLYGYITHNSGFSVLLNRVGKTADNSLGYADSGFDVKFDDDATLGDVHTYRMKLFGNNATELTGALTGTWSPDGRVFDPATITDADPRVAILNSFIGVDPNGKWTLFLADVSAGGSGTLVGWGLEVTNIPEPSQVALLLAGGFALLLLSQRWRKQ